MKTCVRKRQQKTFVTLNFGYRGCRVWVNRLEKENLWWLLTDITSLQENKEFDKFKIRIVITIIIINLDDKKITSSKFVSCNSYKTNWYQLTVMYNKNQQYSYIHTM